MTQKEAFKRGLQATIRYMSGNGDNPNTPAYYIDSEGFKLGSWQSGMRTKYKQNRISSEGIESLEKIGFAWDIRGKTNKENFKRILRETLLYKAAKCGNPHAPRKYITPEGFKLGAWQENYRSQFSAGTLSKEVIKAFSEIGFAWKKLEWEFERHFKATLEHKKSKGNPNTRRDYISPEGIKIGAWQSSLRSGYKNKTLSPEKIKRLEDIGFAWDKYKNHFEEGFKVTLTYKAENNGNPNAALKCIMPEDFKLGEWQNSMRSRYKKGTLSTDRIKRLEDIGFTWNLLDKLFEKGFKATLRYKAANAGNPNTPLKYKDSEDYKLGRWQADVRDRYKKGALSAEKIKRLEDIGFVWSQREKNFEDKFQVMLRFKAKNEGNPNGSLDLIFEDINLGAWQNSLRVNYRKGKLSSDRIEKLEGVGFVWGLKGWLYVPV